MPAELLKITFLSFNSVTLVADVVSRFENVKKAFRKTADLMAVSNNKLEDNSVFDHGAARHGLRESHA